MECIPQQNVDCTYMNVLVSWVSEGDTVNNLQMETSRYLFIEVHMLFDVIEQVCTNQR